MPCTCQKISRFLGGVPKKRKNNVLQTYRSERRKPGRRRAFSGIFPTRGSLTLEAALVLPLFLFGMISLIYLEDAIALHTRLQASLQQTAGKLALYSYAYEQIGDGEEIPGGTAAAVFSKAYVSYRVREDLGGEYLKRAPIQNGGAGLSLLKSSILEDGNIDLVAQYRVCTPYTFLGIKSYPAVQRCRMHAWIGYTGGTKGGAGSEEEIVYITPTGTVYHRDRECTHIELSIRSVASQSVEVLRNTAGGKYYPCEHCGNNTGVFAYVTNTGDRYHSSITCSGLKREVIAVPLSKAGGRPPCLRCGGGGL